MRDRQKTIDSSLAPCPIHGLCLLLRLEWKWYVSKLSNLLQMKQLFACVCVQHIAHT